MPAGSTPVAVAIVTTATVSWSGSTLARTTVAGYVVRRYDAVSGTLGVVGGTCAGVVAATTCTDTGVPIGVWRSSVTPTHNGWTGAEGRAASASRSRSERARLIRTARPLGLRKRPEPGDTAC